MDVDFDVYDSVVLLGQRAGENSSEAYVCSDIRFRATTQAAVSTTKVKL